MERKKGYGSGIGAYRLPLMRGRARKRNGNEPGETNLVRRKSKGPYGMRNDRFRNTHTPGCDGERIAPGNELFRERPCALMSVRGRPIASCPAHAGKADSIPARLPHPSPPANLHL